MKNKINYRTLRGNNIEWQIHASQQNPEHATVYWAYSQIDISDEIGVPPSQKWIIFQGRTFQFHAIIKKCNKVEADCLRTTGFSFKLQFGCKSGGLQIVPQHNIVYILSRMPCKLSVLIN